MDLMTGNNSTGGVGGIGVTLFILQSSGPFCGISQVKIMVSSNH